MNLRPWSWMLLLMSLSALARAADVAGPAGAGIAGHSPAPSMRDKAVPLLGGLLQQTRVIYPLELDGWEAQGEQRYDDQALGVSVRYARTDRPGWIDVFFYPAGALGEAQFAEAMERERNALQAAVAPGGYSELELGESRRFARPGTGPQSARGCLVHLRSVLHGQPLSSAMTLQLRDLYFIKGRMSVPEQAASREAVGGLLEEFMTRLGEVAVITSSGLCWEGGTARGDAGASPPAQAGHGGCRAPEEMDLQVPEGMREIRLEYRLLQQEPDETGGVILAAG